ncbi:SWIM zinc finger family protein [Halorubrum sp. DTA46]|uniref:SWIM zinc finger family protein n=1 Tax=Halorubrum sp. DTA46 TaxID=3402162 RepID=UPI003AAE8FC5
MTHLRHPLTSTSVPHDTSREASPDGGAPDDERSARAAAEPMTVRTLRDRRYVVETDGGTYVVSLDEDTCTCPDHAIRGARCKHLRRVAMDVASGSLPGPDERVGVCAVCGGEAFVPRDADGPQLCARHGFEPGAVVRDRETGDRLVVVAVTTERADAYRTDEGRTVDGYASNADYGDHEPVVEVAYVESIRPDRGVDEAKRYGFPASRLTRRV